MVFVACGLNQTAPLPVREKIAQRLATQDQLLQDLVGLPSVNEALLLSTCLRTEIYCDSEDPEALLPWLINEQGLEADLLSPYYYQLQDLDAVRHALRVSTGLNSVTVGEPQIFGQMKQAYQQACLAGTVKTALRPVFEYVFSASKRIRNRSGIGANPVSVAYAAVQLIGQYFNHYKSLRVFLMGSGDTASLVVKYLQQQGVSQFRIASRSRENALKLAETCQGDAVSICDIPQYLSEADVVVSATACPLPFINKGLVEHALKQRAHAPMFFLDLAVPRDIEPNVAELADVKLYNMDDLQSMIEKGKHERNEAALEAEQMIEGELENYLRRHRSLRAKNVICDYRQQMQTLAEHELKRAQTKLSAGYQQEEVLNELCTRLLKKLAHQPTVGLKKAARDGRDDLLSLTHYLLNPSSEPLPS